MTMCLNNQWSYRISNINLAISRVDVPVNQTFDVTLEKSRQRHMKTETKIAGNTDI